MDPHLVFDPLGGPTHEEDLTARVNGDGGLRIVAARLRDLPDTQRVSAAGWSHTLVLRGELGHDSTGELSEELACLCEEGVTSVVLDLRELCLIDAQGAKAIATGGALCRGRGREMSVLSDSVNVERVLSQAGAGDMLSPHDIDGSGYPRPGADMAGADLRTVSVKDL